jgi:HemY protein
LQHHKILLDNEVKLLEIRTFSRILKQAAESNDADTIQACWADAPEHIRTLTGIANIYFAAMLAAGAGMGVESAVSAQLSKHWDDTTLMLYACIEFPDAEKQLHETEKWLAVYPNDAVLQRVLGKLALKAGQLEKAEQYLTKSIHIDASVDAYQLLGDVLILKEDKDKACEYFKQALALASAEIINRAESVSG